MNLANILVENARIHGRRPAIVDDEGSFTWAELGNRVARAAGVLRDRGLRRGDRFAVLMRNSFRQAELFWAGYWSGAIPVPINWRLSPLEIADILEDSGAKWVAAEEEFLGLLDLPPLAPWRPGVLTVEAAGGRNGEYEALLKAGTPLEAAAVSESDDALLLYTGGTTGRGKGVRLSHRNIFSNAWQIGLTCGIRASDVYSHVAPMFHAADVHGTVGFLLGCRHFYLSHFTPAAAVAAIERHRITVAHWVPTMVKMVCESPETGKHELSSLRMLFYGSSPMPVEWAQAARRSFPGAELYQNYGLTETSPVVSVLGNDTHVRCFASGDYSHLKSAGRPVPGLQMRIVDERGQPLPAGETGEVIVRGPNVSTGYHNRDEETARAFRGGWFHTGDVGRLDEDGNLFLVDRMRDVIITGGENVYSTEVEAVLYRHPGVSEAAVIGVADDVLGEALFAVIVPRTGVALTPDQIIQHCRAYIGGYKIPRRMAFVESLPRSALGKVQKAQLRQTHGTSASAAPREAA